MLLTASPEPCIGTDGQVAPGPRENHAFWAGRAAKSPGCSVKPALHPMPRQIWLLKALARCNFTSSRASLGGHLGNVGSNAAQKLDGFLNPSAPCR